jgi:hypothetical protein
MIEHKKEASLPEPKEGQIWCCSNGCGDCRPLPSWHEHYRCEDMQGRLLESRKERVFVSHCCRKELLLWDEGKQDFVEWNYVEHTSA